MPARIDLVNQRFGKLLVVKCAGRDKNKLLMWLCQCDCGNKSTVRGQDLRRGRQVSCRCQNRERTSARNYVHGMTGTRPYRIWKNMKTRCYNPNSKSYADYGARGVKICAEWLESFDKFWADMEHGYTDNLEIDRIDHNGDYCPENCQWADKKTQNRNTRQNRFVDSPLGYMTIGELAEKSGMPYSILKKRVYAQVPKDKLLLPSQRRGAHD